MDNYSTSIDNENGRSCIRRAFRLGSPLRMEFYEEKGMTSPLVLVIRAGRLDVERKDRPGTGHGGAREGGMGNCGVDGATSESRSPLYGAGLGFLSGCQD